MEIVTKVMEKSWKSHGNLLVKMCTNPVCSSEELDYKSSLNHEGQWLINIESFPFT